jgi:hypothetical protein
MEKSSNTVQPGARVVPVVTAATTATTDNHEASNRLFNQPYEAPRGAWKDGICECFNNL